MLPLLIQTLVGLTVVSVIPSGYYIQRMDKYAMQVQIASPKVCHLEFALIEANMYFNITEAPYTYNTTTHEIVLFPSGINNHPSVAAMDAVLKLTGLGKLTFPARGRYLPSENALEMHMNIDWRVLFAPKQDLVKLAQPKDPNYPMYYVGPLYRGASEVATPADSPSRVADPITAAVASFSSTVCLWIPLSLMLALIL